MIEPFTPADLAVFEERGITLESARAQLALLAEPPRAIRLLRPAVLDDGIERLDIVDQEVLAGIGRSAATDGRISKFVPASGAASRMFKELITALEDHSGAPSASGRMREFFSRLHDFPFAVGLRRAGVAPPASPEDERDLLHLLLEQMRLGELPKGLIPFHATGNQVRTAFEEHLLEARLLVADADGRCRIHFTVSAEAMDDFRVELDRVVSRIEGEGFTLDVSFSVQHPSTDTLAIDSVGRPFRTADGALLFRPGGHGALIRNLEQSGGDIVTIKNIDNILPDEKNENAVHWKRVLAGRLIQLETEVHRHLTRTAGEDGSEEALAAALSFADRVFGRRPSAPLTNREERRWFVRHALDRPLRICGVVRNEGEPGGAPFWTAEADGSESVQIVESSQVDFSDAEQNRIWASSTHFNPVDIVCSLRSVHGTPFDLRLFVDQNAVFVSEKSHEGRELRALELPGLWNGAMSRWNSVFVEVPASTFAPVKTVFDLLRPEHR